MLIVAHVLGARQIAELMNKLVGNGIDIIGLAARGKIIRYHRNTHRNHQSVIVL
jgi:hypothetical protein